MIPKYKIKEMEKLINDEITISKTRDNETKIYFVGDSFYGYYTIEEYEIICKLLLKKAKALRKEILNDTKT